MDLLDRLSRVTRGAWAAHPPRDERAPLARPRRDTPRDDTMTTAAAGHAAAFPAAADRGVRVPAASDVVGALRVLELAGAPSLIDVRAQYQRLARLHHPRTRSARADEARAAGAALDDLTEALELLERHHLPLDAPPR